jgi:hypothetical protein
VERDAEIHGLRASLQERPLDGVEAPVGRQDAHVGVQDPVPRDLEEGRADQAPAGVDHDVRGEPAQQANGLVGVVVGDAPMGDALAACEGGEGAWGDSELPHDLVEAPLTARGGRPLARAELPPDLSDHPQPLQAQLAAQASEVDDAPDDDAAQLHAGLTIAELGHGEREGACVDGREERDPHGTRLPRSASWRSTAAA